MMYEFKKAIESKNNATMVNALNENERIFNGLENDYYFAQGSIIIELVKTIDGNKAKGLESVGVNHSIAVNYSRYTNYVAVAEYCNKHGYAMPSIRQAVAFAPLLKEERKAERTSVEKLAKGIKALPSPTAINECKTERSTANNTDSKSATNTSVNVDIATLESLRGDFNKLVNRLSACSLSNGEKDALEHLKAFFNNAK